jgi:hypothetical protein
MLDLPKNQLRILRFDLRRERTVKLNAIFSVYNQHCYGDFDAVKLISSLSQIDLLPLILFLPTVLGIDCRGILFY